MQLESAVRVALELRQAIEQEGVVPVKALLVPVRAVREFDRAMEAL